MFNNEKSFFLVMLKIARKLVCFRDIAHKSESCSFPAGFRDKAIGTFLKQFQEFIYSQVSCSSSSSCRSSSILRWVVLPQAVTRVYHSVWLGRFFFKQFLEFVNSQVKASSSSIYRSLSTLRLGVLLYTQVGGSSWSSFMNLSSLKSGFLPQAVLEDYLHSSEGLFLKQFQEFVYSLVWDPSSSSSRSLSTLRFFLKKF